MKIRIVNFSEIAEDPNLNLSAQHWIEKGEARQTTKPNNQGRIYAIGDKMELCSRWKPDKIPCEVSEISPSGKYLKVNICEKWYKAENLHQRERRELWQNSSYLKYIGE